MSSGVFLRGGVDTTSVHVLDFGAVGDGVANDRPAINAALAAVPPGGRLVLEPGKVYRLTGAPAAVIDKPLTLEGNSATLLVATGSYPQNRVLTVGSLFGSVLASWREPVAAGQNVFNVAISPSTLPVGSTIRLRLGEDPADGNEEHFDSMCKVLANDGSAITVDVSPPYAINQESDDHDHTIALATHIAENVVIRNLVVEMADGHTVDQMFYTDHASNLVFENISGRGSSLFNIADSRNVEIRNIRFTSLDAGHSSSGRFLTAWQSRNLNVQDVWFNSALNRAAVFLESWTWGARFSNLNFYLTYDGDRTSGVFHTPVSFSNVVESVFINLSGDNAITELFTSGGEPTDIRFDYVEVNGGAPISVQSMFMPWVRRLRYKGVEYREATTLTKVIDLTSNMSNVLVDLFNGILKDIRVMCTDLTGVTSIKFQRQDQVSGGHELSTALTANTWVERPTGFNIVTFGGNLTSSYVGSPYEPKRLRISTGTVNPGAKLYVQMDVMLPADTSPVICGAYT